MSRLLDVAIHLATTAHATQVDKTGAPYILHPLRVGAAGKTEEEMICGVLHDTVEDTTVTCAELRRIFGPTVSNAIECLTRGWEIVGPLFEHHLYFKHPGPNREVCREPYDKFIHRMLWNPLAVRVKINDINDNLSRMAGLPLADRNRLESKYYGALQTLEHWRS